MRSAVGSSTTRVPPTIVTTSPLRAVTFDTVVPGGADNGFDGDYAGFTMTTQFNGGYAKVKGLEIGYSQQFTFLPSPLDGFGFQGNFTLLGGQFDTQVVGGNQRKGIPFPGLSDTIANASLTWTSRTRIKRMLMNAKIKYRVIAIKNILCSIAVMNVKINNGDTLNAIGLHSVTCGDGHVIK